MKIGDKVDDESTGFRNGIISAVKTLITDLIS